MLTAEGWKTRSNHKSTDDG